MNTDLELASSVLLNSLTEDEDTLWQLEALLRGWRFEMPQATARRVLTALAADGLVRFWNWPSIGERSTPISVAEGLAALDRESAWKLGFPAVTASSPPAGRAFWESLPRLPQYESSTVTDPSLAPAIILDLLIDDGEQMLWSIFAVLSQWRVRRPRTVARKILATLAADGSVRFGHAVSESALSLPITADEGLAALRRNKTWKSGYPAVMVAVTQEGLERRHELPQIPKWPGVTKKTRDILSGKLK